MVIGNGQVAASWILATEEEGRERGAREAVEEEKKDPGVELITLQQAPLLQALL